MPVDTPTEGRAKIERVDPDLVITIPVKRELAVTVFLAIFIGAWANGMILALGHLFDFEDLPTTIFLIVWSVGWSFVGGALIVGFLWTLVGREIVTLSPLALTIERGIWSLRRRRTYELGRVRNLRETASGTAPIWKSRLTMATFPGSGYFTFDYDDKTLHFGPFLEETEIEHILGQMRSHAHIRE